MELPRIDSGIYQHSKTGKRYEVLGAALQTETNEPLVIYRPLYSSEFALFARPYAMFVEEVSIDGELKRRFEKIHD